MKIRTPVYMPYIKAIALALIILPLCLLVLSLFMFALQLPKESAPLMGLIALSASALASGFSLGKAKRHSGIKQGFLCGLGLFITVFLLSIIFGQIGWGIIGRLALCLLFGIVGGVAGVNSKIK